jgi:hypothetical protein
MYLFVLKLYLDINYAVMFYFQFENFGLFKWKFCINVP